MIRIRKKHLFLGFAGLLLCTGAWAALDLWRPLTSNLREFDPEEVARLETQMWRSYYDKRELKLFNELAELMRLQYRLPLLRSYVVAYHGAKAAFVFKDGKSRADYERALPALVKYYTAIRKVSDTPFDIKRAAELELEWWIIHRQRDAYAVKDLDRALADLPAEVYRMPVSRFTDHAINRTRAMLLRDELAARDGVTDADWQQIQDLLRQSWRSLWEAVHAS
jgi:hypothetical protein